MSTTEADVLTEVATPETPRAVEPSTLERDPVASAGSVGAEPVWQAAVLSFLPIPWRLPARRVVPHLPVAVVLALQTGLALRLTGSPFQDEALYAYMGHELLEAWRTGVPTYLAPETYFSGAPQLYPVLAAFLDGVGGMGLVRAFSTLCMLSATVAVYWMTTTLFGAHRGRRAGYFAAAAFGLASPVLMLSHFATFDAPSFTLLAWAGAIAVAAGCGGRRAIARSAVVGTLCALAILVKYSSAVDAPFVVALLLVASGGTHRDLRHGLVRPVVAGATLLAVLVGSFATWASPLLDGLRFTTTDRAAMVPATPAQMLGSLMQWCGLAFVLAVVGAVLTARRRPLLALVLAAGTVAAVGYQIRMGEAVSFNKHAVLGLIFGAPLAGVAMAALTRVRLALLLVPVTVWALVTNGAIWSTRLFQTWPDTSALTDVLAYPIASMPYIRMIGDTPEPEQYAFQGETEPWQWTSTYENSFFYEGLDGTAAVEAALRDNYFQLAFFDGSYPISAAVEPRMAEFGFAMTDEIVLPYNGHTWRVYQRFDHLGGS